MDNFRLEDVEADKIEAKLIISKTSWLFTITSLVLQSYLVYEVVALGITENKVGGSDIGLYFVVILLTAVSYLNWYSVLLFSDHYANYERTETFNFFEWQMYVGKHICPVASTRSIQMASNWIQTHKALFLLVPALWTAFEMELLLAQSLLIDDDPLALAITAAEIVLGTYQVADYYLTAKKSNRIVEKIDRIGIKFCCIADAVVILQMFCVAPGMIILVVAAIFTIHRIIWNLILLIPMSTYYVLKYGPWCGDGEPDDPNDNVQEDDLIVP